MKVHCRTHASGGPESGSVASATLETDVPCCAKFIVTAVCGSGIRWGHTYDPSPGLGLITHRIIRTVLPRLRRATDVD